jgi:hypothetical protein
MYIFPALYKYVSFNVLHILKLGPLLLYRLFLLLLLFVFRIESKYVSKDKHDNAFFLRGNIPEKCDFYVCYYSVI